MGGAKKDTLSTATSTTSSMKKWGIPEQTTPEITLLERLVWVKYKTKWWPALLYHSYSELQHHLYDQLDMVLKAQFAMAIMKQMQERREVKVARLLGRSILEVVEVEEETYCEFYWQLPNILPRACKRSHYGNDLDLYFDFHRALDQVEDIIREVSQESFALVPDSDDTTWFERAHMAVHQNEDDTSSIGLSKTAKSRSSSKYQEHVQSAATIISSKDGGAISAEISGLKGVGSDVSKASTNSSKRSARRKSSSPSTRVIEPSPSALSISKSQDLEAPTPSEAKSRRSTKTKASQAMTEVVDNRSGMKSIQTIQFDLEETRDPPNSGSSSAYNNINDHDYSKSDNNDSQWPSSVDNIEQSKLEETKNDAVETTMPKEVKSTERRTLTPFDLLPGLEGDDIVPGLTDQIDGARSTWRDVLGFMSGSRDSPPDTMTERPPSATPDRLHQQMARNERIQATMPRIQNKEMQGLVEDKNDEIYYQQYQQGGARPTPRSEQEPTFWQRLTCYTADL